jgi:hypothetical protein
MCHKAFIQCTVKSIAFSVGIPIGKKAAEEKIKRGETYATVKNTKRQFDRE